MFRRCIPLTPPIPFLSHSSSSALRISPHLRTRFTSQCQILISPRGLRTTPPQPAVPLPITAHGPPPKPPLPAAGEITEMRRKQRERAAEAAAAMVKDGGGGAEGEQKISEGIEGEEKNAEAGRVAQAKQSVGIGEGAASVGRAGAGASPSASAVGKKRLWKEAWVKEIADGTFIPHLDSRPLKTPLKKLLVIPARKSHLAHLIAREWSLLTSNSQVTRAYLLPLTQLSSRVIDLPHTPNSASHRKGIVDMCMKYLDTDTLLCLPPPPNMHMISEAPSESGEEKTLRQMQVKVLGEVLGWIEINVFPGIVIHPLDTAQGFLATTPQPEDTKERVRRWVENLDDWTLVGLEGCVVSAKSLLVGIRLVAGWKQQQKQQERVESNPTTTTGGIPPTSSSGGTNTALSHTSTPHIRPEVQTLMESPEAVPGEDIDPLTGAITSGDPKDNRGTSTGLSGGPKVGDASGKGSDGGVVHGPAMANAATGWGGDVLDPTWGIEEAAAAATLEVAWQTRQWGEVEDTHDVEKADVRRRIGAGWCLVIDSQGGGSGG